MFNLISAVQSRKDKDKLVRLQCDECGFYFVPDTIYTRSVEYNNVQIDFIVCDKCGAVFTLMVRDERMVQLRAEYTTAKAKYQELKKKNQDEQTKTITDSDMTQALVVANAKYRLMVEHEKELRTKFGNKDLAFINDKLYLKMDVKENKNG